MSRRNIQTIIAVVILIIIAVFIVKYLHDATTASSEVSIANNTQEDVKFYDAERSQVLATIRPGETWTAELALGSHDDGHSYTRFVFQTDMKSTVEIESMSFLFSRVVVNGDGICLMSLEGKLQKIYKWKEES